MQKSKNNFLKKGIIIGMIILFIGVSVSSAVDINKNFDDRSIKNTEIKSYEDQKEIISFLSGFCSMYQSKGLIIRNVTFHCFDVDTNITIKSITSFIPFNYYKIIAYNNVTAPHFRGRIRGIGREYMLSGIAFGDITWS